MGFLTVFVVLPILLVTCLRCLSASSPSNRRTGDTDDASTTGQRYLSLKSLQGKDFENHIFDIIRRYEDRNAACKTTYGKFWFWSDGPECQYCGDVCPIGTNSNRCNLHCSGYWAEMRHDKTVEEIELQFKVNKAAIQASNKVALASISMTTVMVLLVILFSMRVQSRMAEYEKRMEERFVKKTTSPMGDELPLYDSRQGSVVTM